MIQRAVYLTALVLPFAALAACSGGAGNQAAANGAAAANGSAAANETVTAAPAGNATASAGGAGSGVRLQPGEWEVAISADGAPAMPPQRTCVTQEMSDRGASEMVSGGASTAGGMTCNREGLSITGGRMSGTATCTGPRGTVTIAMDGQINPSDYDIRQRVTQEAAGREMTVNTHIVGRRVGDCPAGAAGAGNAAEAH